MVFDEAHTYVTQVDFRSALDNISMHVAELHCSKILLSATVPPKLVQPLFKAIGVSSSTTVIREPCIQLKAIYCHALLDKDDEPTAVAYQIGLLLVQKTFKPDSRGIIFCTSIADCQTIAASLKETGTIYYSGYEENQKNMKNWLSGKHVVMVATSAIIAGLDYGYVDFIIFAKVPYGMIDMVQGAGRGGRKGRAYPVIVIDSGFYSSDNSAIAHLKCIPELTAWCKDKTHKCLRSGIGAVMNGVGQSCFEITQAERCGVCDPTTMVAQLVSDWSVRPAPPPSVYRQTPVATLPFSFLQVSNLKRPSSIAVTQPRTKQTLIQHIKSRSTDIGMSSRVQSLQFEALEERKQKYMMDIETKLFHLKRHCISCKLFLHLDKKVTNPEAACPSCLSNLNAYCNQHVQLNFSLWKSRMIKYAKAMTYCWTCDLPQEPYMIESHGPLNAPKTQHPYKDILAVTWLMAFRKANLRQILIEKLGRYGFTDSMTIEQYSQWLTVDDRNMRFSNGVFVFGVIFGLEVL